MYPGADSAALAAVVVLTAAVLGVVGATAVRSVYLWLPVGLVRWMPAPWAA